MTYTLSPEVKNIIQRHTGFDIDYIAHHLTSAEENIRIMLKFGKPIAYDLEDSRIPVRGNVLLAEGRGMTIEEADIKIDKFLSKHKHKNYDICSSPID